MSRHFDDRIRAGIFLGVPLLCVLAILYAVAGPKEKKDHPRLPARPLRGGPTHKAHKYAPGPRSGVGPEAGIII